MQEQPRRKTGIVRLLLSLALLGGAVWLLVNRQAVTDNITVWQYRPTVEVAALADGSRMSRMGQFYFYASRPQVSDRAAFRQQCSSHGEKTAVLGCYSARRIYIFNISDERLDGIKEVTAAHEMLHAVYERLTPTDRERINALLESQLQQVTDERILNLVKLYDEIEASERLNELHSIFATELSPLSGELERYYGRYFTDRQHVVDLALRYEGVFSSIKSQQDQLVAELNSLAVWIESETSAYNAAADTLSSDIRAFNDKASSGGFDSQDQFDAERQALTARQSVLSQRHDSIKVQISTYNRKRDVLESINGQIEALNQSIDSNSLEPAPAI